MMPLKKNHISYVFLSPTIYIQMLLCSSNIVALKKTVTHVFNKIFFNQEHSTSQFGIWKCQEKLSNSKSKLIIQASLLLSEDLT